MRTLFWFGLSDFYWQFFCHIIFDKRRPKRQQVLLGIAYRYHQRNQTMKLVIIGGVAGGASAAARARRLNESAEIILLQSGPDVSFASCGMPYFIGGEITDREQMSVQTPQSLRARLNIDVRVSTRVINIDTTQKCVVAKNEKTDETETVDYDHLVLAVGAEPFKPPIPGIDRPGNFALRNLQDMDAIVGWIQKKQKSLKADQKMHCIVAGAGFVGLEMVEQLLKRNITISVVEMMPQILGPLDVEMAAILEKDLVKNGVNVVTGDGISEIRSAVDSTDPDVSEVILRSGRVLPPSHMIILGLGVRPDTGVIKEAGIECTARGHIIVDDELRTSVAGVWAVGDAIEVNNPMLSDPNEKWAVPLAGPANRQGRMVADNIHGMKRKYKGTYGASVVRLFKNVAACVGMNEKMLQSKGLSFESVHVHPGSHAGYFPRAKSINFKLTFDPTSGKIWGAQAIGEDGVERRIDIISTAMQGNLTVEDLANLELCYAPPLGSAKDPVNMAGMVAQNIVEGLVTQVGSGTTRKMEDMLEDPFFFLDVRNPGEIEMKGTISDGPVINIPLNDLRDRLHELDKNSRYVLVCQSGQRAYYAYHILKQNGFDHISNLSGAFITHGHMSRRASAQN